MKRIEEKFIDKSGWPNGPWQDEPDKIQWLDKKTKLPCLIVRGPLGALCGYVGVPKGHRWYGIDYNKCPTGCSDNWCGHRLDAVLDVHGGLTYSDKCAEHICHKVEPGEPDDVWWLGFDCGHAGDLMPSYGNMAEMRILMSGEYRTVQYVTKQCAQLARQIRDKA